MRTKLAENHHVSAATICFINCKSNIIGHLHCSLWTSLCVLIVMGSRDGTVLSSHQCGLGLYSGPGVISGLSLLMVLALLWGFFSRFSGFPSSTKTNTAKFWLLFDLEMVDEKPLHEIWYYKFLFIYLLISCPQKNWSFLLKCITFNQSLILILHLGHI